MRTAFPRNHRLAREGRTGRLSVTVGQGDGEREQRGVLLGAVDVGVARGARADRPHEGRLERLAGIEPDEVGHASTGRP